MDQKRTKILIQQFLESKATDEETKLIDHWYLKTVQAQTQIDSEADDDAAQIVANMWAKIEAATSPVKKVAIWPRLLIAASFFLILSIGGYFIKTAFYTHQDKASSALQAEIILPGKNKATLTLNGGQQIDLTDLKPGIIAQHKHLSVTKTADGQLTYTSLPQSGNNLIYHTLTTPSGGQFRLTLSDGTKVLLNSGSSITYPEVFNGNERRVEITGEVYFEVAHNAKKPFKVQTPTQEVEVLGTHFNINAYQNEPLLKTTLLEGSIKVNLKGSKEIQHLNPGEQAVEQNGKLEVKEANLEQTVAWTNGYFQFNNEELESIMRKIARWYDVTVTYDGAFKDMRFGGVVSRSKSITETLNLMQSTGLIHFKIEGRSVTVMH